MTNLADETRQAIKDAGKTTKEVAWIGNRSCTLAVSWQGFLHRASNMEYDAGYGTAYIPMDLVVVFRDGSWLERAEYDGAEDWVHRTAPKLNPLAKSWVFEPTRYAGLELKEKTRATKG